MYISSLIFNLSPGLSGILYMLLNIKLVEQSRDLHQIIADRLEHFYRSIIIFLPLHRIIQYGHASFLRPEQEFDHVEPSVIPAAALDQ